MTVGELLALLADLPDDMPVTLSTRGAGDTHIELIGITQARSWPLYVTAECPECGDEHEHAHRTTKCFVPRHVHLGATIEPVRLHESIIGPPAKVYGRWPRSKALRASGIVA